MHRSGMQILPHDLINDLTNTKKQQRCRADRFDHCSDAGSGPDRQNFLDRKYALEPTSRHGDVLLLRGSKPNGAEFQRRCGTDSELPSISRCWSAHHSHCVRLLVWG
jgi:hypothetical protein